MEHHIAAKEDVGCSENGQTATSQNGQVAVKADGTASLDDHITRNGHIALEGDIVCGCDGQGFKRRCIANLPLEIDAPARIQRESVSRPCKGVHIVR